MSASLGGWSFTLETNGPRPRGQRAASHAERLDPGARAHRLRRRHEPAGLAQPVRGHVPVDGLVVPRFDQERLVPDPRAAALSDPPPVLAPDLQVRIVLVPGERLEVLERAPVLDD